MSVIKSGISVVFSAENSRLVREARLLKLLRKMELENPKRLNHFAAMDARKEVADSSVNKIDLFKCG
jgi:hypothetical protein